MDYDGRFIMQKTVDWSLLNDGMTIICDEVSLARQNRCKHHSALALRNIPVSACALLKAWDESILTHGAGKDIKAEIKREQSKAFIQNAEREQARPKVKVLIDGELYDSNSDEDIVE